MNAILRTVTLLLTLGVFAAAATGCNTMRGVGRDTAAVGEKIEEEADRHLDDEPDRTPPPAPAR